MALRSCADEREKQLLAALAEFLDLMDRGLPAHPEVLVGKDPEIADDIREFLRVHAWLERLTAPLRVGSATAWRASPRHAPVTRSSRWTLATAQAVRSTEGRSSGTS